MVESSDTFHDFVPQDRGKFRVKKTDIDFLLSVITDEASIVVDRMGVCLKDHMLQTARLAEKACSCPEFILSCLFHDIGHLPSILVHGSDEIGADNDNQSHEESGADYLFRVFGPDVSEPVRLHAQAANYLIATSSVYRKKVQLRRNRHGFFMEPLSELERQNFEEDPYFSWAIQLAILEIDAVDPNLQTSNSVFRDYAKRIIKAFIDERELMAGGPDA